MTDISTLSPRAQAYLQAVNAPGAFTTMSWERDVAVAAVHRGTSVRKHVSAVVRTGIDFANLARNEERDTGAMTWGEWVVFPLVKTHKGREYARLYTAPNSRVRVHYTIDGQPATREQVADLLTPSKRRAMLEGPREPIHTFEVKMEDLILAA